MKTQELEHFMLNDPFIHSFYGGVVALDEIPPYVEKPSIFIVNTDPAALPSTHWLSLFLILVLMNILTRVETFQVLLCSKN